MEPLWPALCRPLDASSSSFSSLSRGHPDNYLCHIIPYHNQIIIQKENLTSKLEEFDGANKYLSARDITLQVFFFRDRAGHPTNPPLSTEYHFLKFVQCP